MALPRVSIPFNLGPEGFKYHVADGSQTLVTLSGILTHMQRHDEELKAQRERADKAEATVKKLGDELRQLGVKQALLLERADRVELSADKEAVRNTNAHRGAEVRIDALATEAEADRKKTSDLDAALAEGEVARIGAAVAVTNNLMDRTANEIMMRFPYKDEVAAMHQLAEADVPESLEDVASGVDLSLAPAAAPGAAPAPGSDGESVFGVDDFLDGFGEAPAPSPFEATPPTVSAKAVTQMERSATELEKSLEYLMLRMPAPNTIAFDGKPVGLPPYAEKKLAWVVSEVAENLQKLRSTVSKNDAAHSRNSLAVQKQIKLALRADGGPMGAVAERQAAGDTVDADVVHALREDLANVKNCEEEIAQLNLKVQAVEMDATGRSDDVPDRGGSSVGEVLTQAPAHVELDTHIAHFVEAHLAASERHLFAKRGESTRGLGATSSLDDGITLDAALERAADDSLLDPIPASPRREQPLDDDAPRAAAQRLDIKAKLANELRLLETVQDPEGAAGRDGFPPLVDDDWGGEPTLASTRPICLSCRRPTSQHGAQRGGRVLSAHRQFAAQTFQPPDDTQPQRPVLRNQTPEGWIKEKRKNQHHRSQ
ncbi:hypothetical protein JL720_5690 [Aureococcus anophagefferens]|nr:hypothetical protein JL720_5690 [Aureococcus anophagefferens]